MTTRAINGGLLALCLFLLPFAVLTGLGSFGMLLNSYTALTADWRSGTGQVISSQTFPRSSRTWSCYEYEVDGLEFTGYALSNKAAGERLTIFYDAHRPDVSSLKPFETTSPTVTILLTACLITAFIVTGGAFLLCASSIWEDWSSARNVDSAAGKRQLIRILIAGAFFLIACHLLAPHLDVLRKDVKSRNWPTTDATILATDIEERIHVEGAGRSVSFPQHFYVPHIRFAYSIDGEEFEGRKVAAADLELSYGYAHTITRRYPPGSTAKVFVNPENPGDALLIPDHGTLRTRTWYSLIGIVLLLLGVLSLVLFRGGPD